MNSLLVSEGQHRSVKQRWGCSEQERQAYPYRTGQMERRQKDRLNNNGEHVAHQSSSSQKHLHDKRRFYRDASCLSQDSKFADVMRGFYALSLILYLNKHGYLRIFLYVLEVSLLIVSFSFFFNCLNIPTIHRNYSFDLGPKPLISRFQNTPPFLPNRGIAYNFSIKAWREAILVVLN